MLETLQSLPQTRRQLIEAMFSNESNGNNCLSCKGDCCTFAYNSMQITPLEAVEICLYLQRKQRINQSLIETLLQNIKRFRLDKNFSNGKKELLRSYYTCPFFDPRGSQCTLGPTYKPVGCLAFNPTTPDSYSQKTCKQTIPLQSIATTELRNLKNFEIKAHFNIQWDKLPIPLAVLKTLQLEAMQWNSNSLATQA